MAKQTGILPIEGTIDNLTFFKSADGYLVKKRGGIAKEKIANDPNFQRTRENNAEFGRAGKAGKLLRNALRNIIAVAKDHRLPSRLTTVMLKVIQQDAVSTRGERNVIDGEAALLAGFETNIHGKLANTVYAPYSATIDRVTGLCKVQVGAFIPANQVSAPAGTTHFRLFDGAAGVDFEAATYENAEADGGYMAYNNSTVTATELSVNLAANSTHPLFLAFGIEFLQEVNGSKYPLKNGSFNACAIVKVDTPV